MSHWFYNPGSSHFDFTTFLEIRDKLEGIRFINPQNAMAAFEKGVEDISKEDALCSLLQSMVPSFEMLQRKI